MIARLALLLALTGTSLAASAAPVTLEPYKMVRSLQLVQDKLARGDHAALPMQRKLLEMIDERFRHAGDADFQDARNRNALVIYALSGGNPTTFELSLAKVAGDASETAAHRGILAYMRGDFSTAKRLLGPVDPKSLGEEVGAFVALVKGSTIGRDSPASAIRLLDQARLYAPGTLVEEAALRRSLPLAIATKDAERFMLLASQYTRRFLGSPFASQFADAFVDGLVAFHEEVDVREIEQAVSFMGLEHQAAIFLRLGRRAMIAGLAELSIFATERAEMLARGEDNSGDPRAELYTLMSALTSENARQVAADLERIDARRLSQRDRRLLTAARAMAGEMLARPAASEADVSSEPLPPDERPVPAAVTPLETTLDAGSQASMEHSEAATAADDLIANARAKLEAVDRLLGERKP